MSSTPVEPRPAVKQPRSWRRLARELGKFGSIGALSGVLYFVVFNLLMFAGPAGIGLLYDQPVIANIVSMVLSTVLNYIGNRWWTYRHHRHQAFGRQTVLFIAVNVGATAIMSGCAAFSRYVLGLEGPLPDNISTNVVGTVLATLFRWICYRTVVFADTPAEPGTPGEKGV